MKQEFGEKRDYSQVSASLQSSLYLVLVNWILVWELEDIKSSNSLIPTCNKIFFYSFFFYFFKIEK